MKNLLTPYQTQVLLTHLDFFGVGFVQLNRHPDGRLTLDVPSPLDVTLVNGRPTVAGTPVVLEQK